MTNAPSLITAWDTSYSNRDNFLFYPNEEVIRFASKYVRKQLDLNKFDTRSAFSHRTPRWLDLGCGIGRHVAYGHALGCEVYGIDLSHTAIEFAKKWATSVNIPDVNNRLLVGDVSALPWDDGFFDVVISHGVLDSMPLVTAQAAVKEVSRVLNWNGLFYCDFIASKESLSPNSIPREEVVASAHERGTIQSYFNRAKLDDLISPYFTYSELILADRHDLLHNQPDYRFHAALKPKD